VCRVLGESSAIYPACPEVGGNQGLLYSSQSKYSMNKQQQQQQQQQQQHHHEVVTNIYQEQLYTVHISFQPILSISVNSHCL